MSPADEKTLLQQGIAAARAGDKTSARAKFRELAARNFDNELAWLWLASVSEPSHALACLRRVLEINSKNDKARTALVRLLTEKGVEEAQAGNKTGAHAIFLECATVDASNELVWTWLASTAPTARQALGFLRHVLRLNPAHDQASRTYKKLLLQQGTELAQSGEMTAARDLLTEASTVDPDNELVWLWLGRVVPAEDSVRCFERALQINPASEVAQAALQQLRPQPATEDADAAAEDDSVVAVADSDEDGFDVGAIELVDETLAAGDAALDVSIVHSNGSSGPASHASSSSSIVWETETAVAEMDAVSSYEQAAQSTYEQVAQGHHQPVAGGYDPATYDEAAAYDPALFDPSTFREPVAEGPVDEATLHDAYGEPRIDESVDGGPTIDAEPSAGETLAALNAEFEADASTAVDASADGVDEAADAGLETAAAADGDSEAADAVGDPAGDVAAPPPVDPNAPPAWHCAICHSGAPEGAVRCPLCGSVSSLEDPDLLLHTEDVDRRHVLQVVARLKNRASGTNPYEHQLTLGLAYLNAGKTKEGLAHLRKASQARPSDQTLRARVDALEQRAAQGGSRANGRVAARGSVKPIAASTNGAARPAEPPAPTPHVPKNGSARLILVVDDSPTIQKVVAVTLEAHGHEVVTASDGIEALEKLRTVRPDLVLLDITMPNMDGYQLCKILRTNDSTKHVPIVMLSGKDGLFDKMRGRMAGAANYITKPFAPSALPPLVDKYCKRAN